MLVTEQFADLLRLQDPDKVYHPTENPWVRGTDWFVLKAAQLLLQRDVAARLRAFSPLDLDGTFSLDYRGGPITLWFHDSFASVARNSNYDIDHELDRFETYMAGHGPHPSTADTAPAGLFDAASDGRHVFNTEKWRWALRAPRRVSPGGAYSSNAAEALATRIMEAVALRDAQSAERDEELAAALVSERAERRAAVLAEAQQWFPEGGWS